MLFEAFDQSVSAIAQEIKKKGFLPDALVAIARGGWIPARLLSKHLGVKRLYSFGVTYADDSRTTLTCYDQPFPEIEGQTILLIEDYLESGKSMKFCLDQLEQNGNSVKTFAVKYKPESLIVPDFTLGVVDTIPCLPWD